MCDICLPTWNPFLQRKKSGEYRKPLQSQHFSGIIIIPLRRHSHNPITAGSQQQHKTDWTFQKWSFHCWILCMQNHCYGLLAQLIFQVTPAFQDCMIWGKWHVSFIEAFCGNPKPTGQLQTQAKCNKRKLMWIYFNHTIFKCCKSNRHCENRYNPWLCFPETIWAIL